jgi:hypothetical protein
VAEDPVVAWPHKRESEQLIRDYFQRHTGDWEASEPVHAEVAQLAEGILDPEERASLEVVETFERSLPFRGTELDLVIGFVQEGLERSVPTPVLAGAVTLLKRYLGIEGGEFQRQRPVELARLIGERLEAILSDGLVDSAEDLEQAEVQRMFDLSYDDFLALGRVAIERAFSDLQVGTTSRFMDSVRVREAKLRALYPIYRLATARPRTPGALY